MSVSRLTAEKNAKAVHEIALLRGNDRCADCKTRNPRWASHNLGIFICVSCASIHRKIGTHITKVKSLTLDSWSKEQVDTMRNIGNIKSNQLYNPDEVRHPPPTNMVDSERDGELEKFIRDKYVFKRFMNKSAVVQQHLGPSRSITSVRDYPPARSATAPLSPTSPTARSQISPPTTATSFGVQQPSSSALLSSNPPQPQRSSTNPFPPVPPTSSNPVSQATQAHASASAPTSGPWDDLIPLQGSQDSSVNASMPLQYAPTMSSQPMSIPNSPIDQSAANYTRTGMPGASPNFTGASPNFGGGLASSFTAGAAPSFATGSSPSFGAAAGGFSSGAFQQQSSPANPFSQMMTQQAYQQPQPSFMPSNTPSNPFPRQTSPFQPQQSPFQLQQPSFQPQMPSLQSQQAAFQPPQFQMQPPIGTQQQQFGQQPANPFFNQQQQQQQQQQQYSQFAASPMVISPAMSPQGGTPMGMNVGMGMGMSSPFGQSAPQQATNPFTSWMTQPTQVQGGQWGAR